MNVLGTLTERPAIKPLVEPFYTSMLNMMNNEVADVFKLIEERENFYEENRIQSTFVSTHCHNTYSPNYGVEFLFIAEGIRKRSKTSRLRSGRFRTKMIWIYLLVFFCFQPQKHQPIAKNCHAGSHRQMKVRWDLLL